MSLSLLWCKLTNSSLTYLTECNFVHLQSNIEPICLLKILVTLKVLKSGQLVSRSTEKVNIQVYTSSTIPILTTKNYLDNKKKNT